MTEQEILETNSMTSRCPTCHTPIRIGTPEQVVAYLERRVSSLIERGSTTDAQRSVALSF